MGGTEVRKANAQKLADGYTKEKRAAEIVSIAACYSLWVYNFIKLARLFVHSNEITVDDWIWSVPAAFCGVLFADFVSGVAHWALDTWGDAATPVFGAFIRSFREHHVDQMSITRHDYIETNGDNSMPIVPLMILMAVFPATPSGGSLRSPVLHSFFIVAAICIAFTNQAHKMSHSVKQPVLVRKLMDAGIIMSQKHHRIHHSGDFSAYYCITTGWLNAPLDAIGFWRGCEAVITATTGAIPRADDKEMLGDK